MSGEERAIWTVAAGVVGALLLVLLVIAVAAEDERFPHPAPTPTSATPTVQPTIDSEAGMFRDTGRRFASAPESPRNAQAHPRTMEHYRRLRAYPGAPPRVPHGLTHEEYRRVSCNGCHERGGWVARFGAYAPVTPHPESTACLQCHVPPDELIGRPLPASPREPVCRQCHLDPDAPGARFVASAWQSASWPELGRQAFPGGPTLIPHDVETRTNCVACHAGPAAVAEIRTDHPEREHCRQCHVPSAPSAGEWNPQATPSGVTGPGDSSGGG